MSRASPPLGADTKSVPTPSDDGTPHDDATLEDDATSDDDKTPARESPDESGAPTDREDAASDEEEPAEPEPELRVRRASGHKVFECSACARVFVHHGTAARHLLT